MRTVRALWGSSHPGPSAVVTALAVGLGVATGLDPWRIAVLAAAVLCGQLSVGISNDVIDLARDRAVGRSDKPLARGEVSARTAWTAAIGALGAALALSAVLGPGLLGAHALALASAWSYNAGLKSTGFSVVPFLVSFGIFPSFATLASATPAWAPLWQGVAGAALGAAVHVTNVLPDFADDARTGVRGLGHRIGARACVLLAVAATLVGAVAVLLGPVSGDLAPIAPLAWVFFAAVVAVVLVTAVRAASGPPTRTLFRLTMLAALLLATQLIVTAAT